jgi:hypothetical protein
MFRFPNGDDFDGSDEASSCTFGRITAISRIEKNLVLSVFYTILSTTMNRKLLPWLLAIAAVTLVLSSCASQEGVAPAEGELSRGHPGY